MCLFAGLFDQRHYYVAEMFRTIPTQLAFCCVEPSYWWTLHKLNGSVIKLFIVLEPEGAWDTWLFNTGMQNPLKFLLQKVE